jgi:hypothetical protein
MDDAIRAHFLAETDAFLMEYILQASGQSADPTCEETRYLRSTARMQPYHHSMGLLNMLQTSLSGAFVVDDDGEEED